MFKLGRPRPPDTWANTVGDVYRFQPAPEIYDWLHETILNENSKVYNPDHEHLVGHSGVAFLWAESSFAKQGRFVHGQAELVAFRVSGWQRDRQEAQIMGWFGELPKAIITLSAGYCRSCSDDDFCALVEHELYHLAHKQSYKGPCYDDQGRAALSMRGHDVEEFLGVVERYGASREVQRMVDLANQGATLSRGSIAHACGTCLLRLA